VHPSVRTETRRSKQPRVTTAQSNRCFDLCANLRRAIAFFSARSPCQETPVCGNFGTSAGSEFIFASRDRHAIPSSR
jgi:hypothetical protein